MGQVVGFVWWINLVVLTFGARPMHGNLLVERGLSFVVSALVAGFALVVASSQTCWGQILTEETKLLASDGAEGDRFGRSVALSYSRVAVGASDDQDNGHNSGSAYLFDAVTGYQMAKLLPSDGGEGDFFGHSIAIDNNYVVVGAYRNNHNGMESGAAYIFDASTGIQIAKLVPDDADEYDRFGFSIAIDAGIVAVGAPLDDDNGYQAGSAYLYEASTGIQLFKLQAQDGVERDEFGDSIDIHNGVIVVGANGCDDNGRNSGAAYLFDATTGAQIAKLLATDGAEGDVFGQAVAIDGDLVAVGAPRETANGEFSGSVYLFEVYSGAQVKKFDGGVGAVGDHFGRVLAFDNTIILVGTVEHLDRDLEWTYLFDALSGEQITKFRGSDSAKGDGFGASLAINDGVVVAGAPGDSDHGDGSGSAYIIEFGSILSCLDLGVTRLIGGWRAEFTVSDGVPGERCVTVYGTQRGEKLVNDFMGLCATFGIGGVKQRERVIGGAHRFFDGNGEIAFGQQVPGGASGLKVLFQSAERGTCPEECVSGVLEMVVE